MIFMKKKNPHWRTASGAYREDDENIPPWSRAKLKKYNELKAEAERAGKKFDPWASQAWQEYLTDEPADEDAYRRKYGRWNPGAPFASWKTADKASAAKQKADWMKEHLSVYVVGDNKSKEKSEALYEAISKGVGGSQRKNPGKEYYDEFALDAEMAKMEAIANQSLTAWGKGRAETYDYKKTKMTVRYRIYAKDRHNHVAFDLILRNRHIIVLGTYSGL